MSGSFFKKSKIDSDRVSEEASSLDDLVSSVESLADELKEYARELESIKDDMESAETADDIADIIGRLEEISEPDGYDFDSTPSGFIDSLREVKSTQSEFDDWKEDIDSSLHSLEAVLLNVRRGSLTPSQRSANELDLSLEDSGNSNPRISRPGAQANQGTYLELAVFDHAIKEVCMAAGVARNTLAPSMATDTTAAQGYRDTQVAKLYTVLMEVMAWRTSEGVMVDAEPRLALMWFIDDVLSAAARKMRGDRVGRVVVTTEKELRSVIMQARGLRNDFKAGCVSIEESVEIES
jgi:hypothetical protein